MQSRRRWLVAVGSPVVLVLLIGVYRSFVLRGHTGTLHAGIIVRKDDSGIPGITKTYEGRIRNFGLLPIAVTRCDFMSDAFERGTIVAYAVQKWDASAGQWQTVVASDAEFCKPYPLGIVEGRLVTAPLWPLASPSTGDEATAARDSFHVGDRVRFVIFTGRPGDLGSSIPTPSFTIDEARTGPLFPARIRH